MAEYDNSTEIGTAFVIAPTATEIENADRFDKTMRAGLGRLTRHAPQTWSVPLVSNLQVPDGSAILTPPYVIPYPCKLLRIDASVALQTSAPSVLTCDILREPAAGGGYVTVLNAPTSILNGGTAGVAIPMAPENGLEEMEAGDKIHASWTATDGTADGAIAYAHFIRR